MTARRAHRYWLAILLMVFSLTIGLLEPLVLTPPIAAESNPTQVASNGEKATPTESGQAGGSEKTDPSESKGPADCLKRKLPSCGDHDTSVKKQRDKASVELGQSQWTNDESRNGTPYSNEESSFTLSTWKWWVGASGILRPIGLPTSITVVVDGQTYEVECAGSSNPENCGVIELAVRPGTIRVEEPSPPPGWQPFGVGEVDCQDVNTSCYCEESSCVIGVVNVEKATYFWIVKAWIGSAGPINGPEALIEVSVNGV